MELVLESDIERVLEETKHRLLLEYANTTIGYAIREEVTTALQAFRNRIYECATQRQKDEMEVKIQEEAHKKPKDGPVENDKEVDNEESKEAPAKKQKRESGQHADDGHKEDQVMILLQNNMCFGGGFQQNQAFLVPWTVVKATVFGAEFQDKTICFSSYDVSVPEKASEVDRQRSDALDLLTSEKGVCFYTNEGDDKEEANRLQKVDGAAFSRILVVRAFC